MAERGPAHPEWRGDDARDESKRARAQRMYRDLGTCEHDGCDAPATDRHHKDGDTGNNLRTNLAFLCRRHHMLVDGRLAGLAEHRQEPQAPKPCSNCERPSKPLRRGRCHACNEYLRRTGHERPIDAATGEPLVRRFVGSIA